MGTYDAFGPEIRAAVAAQKKSAWTTDRPTRAGWWWFRDANGNEIVVEIVMDAVGTWVQWFTKNGKVRSSISLDKKRGEWQPVAEPEE